MTHSGKWFVDPTLRAHLVCPRCRGSLVDEDAGLCCLGCQRVYPVEDGVPFVIAERAIRVNVGMNVEMNVGTAPLDGVPLRAGHSPR